LLGARLTRLHDYSIHTTHTSSSSSAALAPSITPSLFHSKFKTYLLPQILSIVDCWYPPDCLHGLYLNLFFCSIQFSCFYFCFFFNFFLAACGRLSWFSVSVKIAISYRVVSYPFITTRYMHYSVGSDTCSAIRRTFIARVNTLCYCRGYIYGSTSSRLQFDLATTSR